ncbi:MAG TPA: GtrA family protein [Hyphomicrobium sp.]
MSAGHHLPRLAVMPQLSRYAIVSVLSLALDFAVFLALNGALGLPTLAGVSGYGCGILLHYHLSRRFVFDTSRSLKSGHRMLSEFVASGLIGLAVTAGVIALATTGFGWSPIIAKVAAAGASFLGVFLIRRTIVFA